MSERELYQELESTRLKLEDFIGKGGGDSCAKFVVEALKDTKVQKAFVKHITGKPPQDFTHVTCHPSGPVDEHVEIIFWFICRPPIICILPYAFAAQYDPKTGSIIEVIDPYMGNHLTPRIYDKRASEAH